MIDLKIVRIPDSPMKLVMNGIELYGAFYYGDHFYRKESFTEDMKKLAEKFHADTLIQRLEEAV